MSINQKQQGYTLLEILFVIVLIAIMSLVGLQFLKNQVDSVKVDTANTQIHNWLQAGLAYYEDYARWPATTVELMPDYIALGSDINPWGLPYVVAPLSSTEEGVFGIQTKLPDVTLATRVAAKLPFTSVSGTSLTAFAGTAVEKYKQIQIKSLGDKVDLPSWEGDTDPSIAYFYVSKPTCPAGMSKEIAVFINSFQKGCLMAYTVGGVISGVFSGDVKKECTDYNIASVLTGPIMGSIIGAFGDTKVYTGFHKSSAIHISSTGSSWAIYIKTTSTAPNGLLDALSGNFAGDGANNFYGSLSYVTYCKPE